MRSSCYTYLTPIIPPSNPYVVRYTRWSLLTTHPRISVSLAIKHAGLVMKPVGHDDSNSSKTSIIPNIVEYMNKREAKLEEIAAAFGTDREVAKNLITGKPYSAPI